MKVHLFEQHQILPISPAEAWDFFSNPKNLDDLTPPDLAFDTLSGDDEAMFQGQIVVHRIQLVPKIWTRWTTEITTVEDGSYFIDEQRSGPYRFWQHLHRFEACDEGTKMLDRVHYALPFFPFGEIGLMMVRSKLDHIFSYRRQCLEERYGEV
tara:strand:- start:1390 stop:1848 length:459 start_codon:yes stop_codon:yes gene_type:complete